MFSQHQCTVCRGVDFDRIPPSLKTLHSQQDKVLTFSEHVHSQGESLTFWIRAFPPTVCVTSRQAARFHFKSSKIFTLNGGFAGQKTPDLPLTQPEVWSIRPILDCLLAKPTTFKTFFAEDK